jgi:hypothetical protein
VAARGFDLAPLFVSRRVSADGNVLDIHADIREMPAGDRAVIAE